ncbi:MAG: nuclear transport factor 2 family protein [Bacteroidia bacterium]|nr:nuclear transport factor 2 family protein [Bacteroidia bacterium]NNF30855.1 nuclear transport factor 2 family protein [Flavobacteriaceae bacterium]MBT8275438.1 nuclear transport factor 2 family protein [Bacteroidia bacterium]NNJ82532.1 nuclear transport factor 2 family protein [Flavobacteriaceae bacterium]NNK54468.1 nuclear transport factor 2 family protein [Flavobacteriaceae bacterium]
MKVLIFFLLTLSFGIHAQVDRDSELFKTLQQKDSLIFKRGFNHCELEVFIDFIAEDLEFYHDKAGITNNKAAFVKQFKNGICGNPDFSARRELIQGSLEVYPLYDNGNLYGALQKGIHKFYAKPKDKPEITGSTARFTHLWLLLEGEWILKRVLSYNHLIK